MPAPKGHKRYGGRVAGTPNKSTQTLLDVCARHNLDVFEAMVVLAVTERNAELKFGRLKEIAQYLYPKRKAIEHSGQIDGLMNIADTDLDKKIADLEKRLKKNG